MTESQLKSFYWRLKICNIFNVLVLGLVNRIKLFDFLNPTAFAPVKSDMSGNVKVGQLICDILIQLENKR